MFRRLFWLFLGVGVGMGSSFWVTRRVKQAAARYTPERLSNDLTDVRARLGQRPAPRGAGGPRGRCCKREAELRAELPRSVG